LKKKILVLSVLVLFLSISVGALRINVDEAQNHPVEKIDPDAKPMGYTPISLLIPKDGKHIHKNAPLVILTERLTDVCCSGPIVIEVTITTCGPAAEVIASGSQYAWLEFS
jgi:hypothetical protein